jgi:hypothetical protein
MVRIPEALESSESSEAAGTLLIMSIESGIPEDQMTGAVPSFFC